MDSSPLPLSSELLTDELTRTVYATDNSIYQLMPEAVSLPSSADEVHSLLSSNAASDNPRPIVARGGGTGTNGQSLTTGIMVDLKRGMDQILNVDTAARTAVVQPGVVTQRLNDELRTTGLFWAPHTSTLSRATVGGMIATDAAGKGSMVHGRAHRHVLSLDVCLADGTAFHAEPVPVAEAERRAAEPGRAGEIWQALLQLDIEEGDRFDLPELARGFSGYGIDRLRRDGMIDPLALLVGSEGTLGITTRATLRLTPIARHTTLIVAAYASFSEALADSVELRETGPTAIESFDERTLAAGRASPAWPALGKVIGDLQGAVLLLEYESDEPIDAAAAINRVEQNGRAVATATLDDPKARSDAWKVRADAVGLLAKVEVGGPELSARPTAMVEDCAVPVANMVEFIDDFRRVLDGFGLEYGMFGHADVGCVHVRPALDTTDPGHEALVRTVTDAVAQAVKRHGGVLWGEHGRGLRGDVAEEFLTASTIELMRQVKTVFDPTDLLNPGKLYRPTGIDVPITAIDEAPMRGQVNRSVPVSIRRDFAEAFACNGNGLCQQYQPRDAMCPSFKATGDPALSPKGRADLIRSYLVRAEDGGDPEFEDALAENLHQCLSCAACTGACPVEVDIPELKSRFLESYYSSRSRPRAHAVLSRFEHAAALASKVPALAKLGAKPVGRLLGLVDLPTPKARTIKNTYPTFSADERTRGPERRRVVLIRDVFTAYLEPDTLTQAAAVLGRLGLDVSLTPFVPSGKFDHVKGKRRSFTRAALAQAELIDSIRAAGAEPVVIEPAVGLLHDHEYRTVNPGHPTDVLHLVDVLYEHRSQLQAPGSRAGTEVTLLAHCTERSTRPVSVERWAAVLTAAGHAVTVPDLGCCGMAGIFGHEIENQDLSRNLWDLGWDQAVAAAASPVATGYSCRSQAARLSDGGVVHPVHLL